MRGLVDVLAAGGFSIAVVAPDEVSAVDWEEVPEQRDISGRRFPAHADERPIRMPHHWWFVRQVPSARDMWPAYMWQRLDPWTRYRQEGSRGPRRTRSGSV